MEFFKHGLPPGARNAVVANAYAQLQNGKETTLLMMQDCLLYLEGNKIPAGGTPMDLSAMEEQESDELRVNNISRNQAPFQGGRDGRGGNRGGERPTETEQAKQKRERAEGRYKRGECLRCGQKGHFKSECPNKAENEKSAQKS
jgi:hypothetical protein